MSQTAVAPAVPAKKARLDAVDGVRGLMALMIVLNHWSTGNAWGRFGWTGLYNLLEIFFMISGFFIALSALKPKPWDPAVVVDHITKRADRLWLHYLFSVFLVFVLMAVMALLRGSFDGNYGLLDAAIKNYHSEGFSLNLFKNIFLLQAFSIQHYEINYNYPGWSLSVEVFGGAVLFAVLSRFKAQAAWITAFFGFFFWVLLQHDYNSLEVHVQEYNNFVVAGLLRFFMDACIGAFIFTQVSKINWSSKWSMIEPLVWIAMLYILWRPDSPHAYKDYMMLPFGGLFVIMLTKSESLSQKIFSTAPFKFLGKYSLSVFLFHAPILMLLQWLNVFQHNQGIMMLVDKILVLVVVLILVVIFEKTYFTLREKFNWKIG